MICNLSGRHGAPGRIRTPDPLIRSQMLYPAELQAPMGREMGLEPTTTGITIQRSTS